MEKILLKLNFTIYMLRTISRLLFVASILASNVVFASDFYIDSVAGNNFNSGLSSSAAWQDISKINLLTIPAGSNVFLKCGSVWNGQQLKFLGSGSAGNPIKIDKYGSGVNPVLNGNGLIGQGVVYLFNQQYIEVNNLEITNAPNGAVDSDFFVGINDGTINNNPQGADRRGVMVVIDNYGVANHIYLKNLNIHHVKGQLGSGANTVNGAIPKKTGGIYFAVLDINETASSMSRFNDVLIDSCTIHYCENIGLAFDNEWDVFYPGSTEYADWYARRFSNIKISNNVLHHIGKNAMIIRCTDNTCLIERNVCYETAMGTTGNTMFTARAKGTVFQYNEGYFNRGTTQTVDPGGIDGSMYDPDYGSVGIIFQYSYSHDNSEGIFWGCNTRGLANNVSGIPDPEDVGCTLRYCISQNDQGKLVFLNYATAGVEIYNNVFYVKTGLYPAIIKENSSKNHTYNFYNNIIFNQSASSGGRYEFGSGTGIQTRTIENNVFYGFHHASEPADIFKIVANPRFVSSGSGAIGISSLNGYKLQAISPAIGNGKLISNNGGLDFYGNIVSDVALPERGVYSVQNCRNPTTGGTISGNQSIALGGDPVAFSNVASPAGQVGTLEYQWQSSTNGYVFVDIVGANSVTYDPPTGLTIATFYRRMVKVTCNPYWSYAVASNILFVAIQNEWTGATNSSWYLPANWSAGVVPSSSDIVVIPDVVNDPIVSGLNTVAYASTITILAGAFLTIESTNSIIVKDAVEVNSGGQFFIKDGASLIQINDVNNIGIINVERKSQPMYRYDFTYWGSPMTLGSNFTLGNLSPQTLADKYYSWLPTNAGSFGTWTTESITSVMTPGKGYAVRAPESFSADSAVKSVYTANFVGTPNNGTIPCPIFHGTIGMGNNNDKYNLISNPYPSAVSAELFLSDPANAAVIDGTIYFWTHNSIPSTSNIDPFYGDFVVNYAPSDFASWNRLGGTGTTSAAGSGGSTPNGFIASGQAFFTRSNGTAPSGNPIIFKNSMRDGTDNILFFRNASSVNSLEKHRVWLNLLSSGGSFNQILVGYVASATYGLDRDFDGVRLSQDNSFSFYSLVNDQNLSIQGRALPFDDTDQVRLGFKSVTQDTFSLRIDHLDGLFENQNLYLEDLDLSIIHDLRESPYEFSAGIGTFDNRFVLRYTNSSLGITNYESNQSVFTMVSDKVLKIRTNQNIENVMLFDVSGKLIQTYTAKEKTSIFSGAVNFSNGVYLVKVKLISGVICTKKVVIL